MSKYYCKKCRKYHLSDSGIGMRHSSSKRLEEPLQNRPHWVSGEFEIQTDETWFALSYFGRIKKIKDIPSEIIDEINACYDIEHEDYTYITRNTPIDAFVYMYEINDDESEIIIYLSSKEISKLWRYHKNAFFARNFDGNVKKGIEFVKNNFDVVMSYYQFSELGFYWYSIDDWREMRIYRNDNQ